MERLRQYRSKREVIVSQIMHSEVVNEVSKITRVIGILVILGGRFFGASDNSTMVGEYSEIELGNYARAAWTEQLSDTNQEVQIVFEVSNHSYGDSPQRTSNGQEYNPQVPQSSGNSDGLLRRLDILQKRKERHKRKRKKHNKK